MIKTFCDICEQEINTNEPIFSITIETKRSIPFYQSPSTLNKGEVCNECANRLKQAIRERSK